MNINTIIARYQWNKTNQLEYVYDFLNNIKILKPTKPSEHSSINCLLLLLSI